jgi:hypothetical protein
MVAPIFAQLEAEATWKSPPQFYELGRVRLCQYCVAVKPTILKAKSPKITSYLNAVKSP